MEGKEWEFVSHEAKHLISKLLLVDPEDRYDAVKSLDHPWITETQRKCVRKKYFLKPPRLI